MRLLAAPLLALSSLSTAFLHARQARQKTSLRVLAECETTTDLCSTAETISAVLKDVWQALAAPPAGGAVLQFPACERLQNRKARGGV